MRKYDDLNEKKTTSGGFLVVQEIGDSQAVAEFPPYVNTDYAKKYLKQYLEGVARANEIDKQPKLAKGLCKGMAYLSPNESFAVGSIAALPWGGFLFPVKGAARRWLIAFLPCLDISIAPTKMRLVAHSLMILLVLAAIYLLM